MLTEPTLIIKGRASNLLTKKIFGRSDARNEKYLVLFCDYSEFEIPIGAQFSIIKNDKIIIFSGIITLKKVTQQFFTFMESIPLGWQTICQFEFETKVPEDLRHSIPVVQDWFSANHITFELR